MSTGRPPIAIVGAGCRFPGSHGPEEFWATLVAEREEIVDTPPYRAGTGAGLDPRETRRGVNRRGWLGDVDGFDWRAFRMSPRESKYADPQQRLLLEIAWEALEDAGLPFEAVAGTRTAVFMGIMWPDYAKLLADNPALIVGYATSGVGFALAANRISHAFDLRGPSVSLDVQCASSLVAVHLAAASIWSGDAELALAGGVNLILTADSDLMMSRAGILSPSGSCMTFDAGADGFVRGEGAGVVVLKPLARARADCDRVLAVIRGSACNHDGRRAPLTAPSHQSQVELVRNACATAGIEPRELDYVELHGTGTQKGDPIEAHALAESIGDRPCGDPCLVGSVKTNIGHCESAAGVASLIKVALALHRRWIPATINHRELHPDIAPLGLTVELVAEGRDWPPRSRSWRAGVSGLSLGGGNAHIVLEQAPAATVTEWAGTVTEPAATVAPPSRFAGPLILPLSARSSVALRKLAGAYAECLENLEGEDGHVPLQAMCAAAALRRTHHECRTAAVGETADELATALRRFAASAPGTSEELPRGVSSPPGVALLLPAAHTEELRGTLTDRLREWGVEPICSFAQEVDPVAATRESWDVLIELGPPSRLGVRLVGSDERPTRRTHLALPDTGREAERSLTGPEAERSLRDLAAGLFSAGCTLRWSALYGPHCPAVPLPTYCWDRERLWIDPLPLPEAELAR